MAAAKNGFDFEPCEIAAEAVSKSGPASSPASVAALVALDPRAALGALAASDFARDLGALCEQLIAANPKEWRARLALSRHLAAAAQVFFAAGSWRSNGTTLGTGSYPTPFDASLTISATVSTSSLSLMRRMTVLTVLEARSSSLPISVSDALFGTVICTSPAPGG